MLIPCSFLRAKIFRAATGKNISGVGGYIENGHGGQSSLPLGSRPYPQGPFQESRNARSAIAIKSICCLSQQNKQADQQTVKRATAVAATAPGLSISITRAD